MSFIALCFTSLVKEGHFITVVNGDRLLLPCPSVAAAAAPAASAPVYGAVGRKVSQDWFSLSCLRFHESRPPVIDKICSDPTVTPPGGVMAARYRLEDDALSLELEE